MDKFQAAFTGATVTQKTESGMEFPMRIVGAEPRKPVRNPFGFRPGIKENS